jgi:hypothetical protein
MKVKNPELYEVVKKVINKKYPKHSAYRSGAYIKLYKNLGGEFIEDNSDKPLKRWFKEEWEDVGEGEYPLYRPTIKIDREKTPLTVDEIDKKDLIKKDKLKQKIKGKSNLPPFVPKERKGGVIDERKRSLAIYTDILGHLKEHLKGAIEGKEELDPRDVIHSKILSKEIERLERVQGGGNVFSEELKKYSNPNTVLKKAKDEFGDDVIIKQSTKREKKYMIYDPNTNKWVHFGQLYPPMEDFTKHQDLSRRDRYLKRATKIKGKWRKNPYSSNNLSLYLLWDWDGKNI